MNEINVHRRIEVDEIALGNESFKEIKPTEDISDKECDDFWDTIFSEEIEKDNLESNLESIMNEYFDDLRHYSEFPETIPDHPFDISDLKYRTPEENTEMREAFDDVKAELKKQWEITNGISWPKYDRDVYSSNGNLIRKAGSSYDAHHILPLGMGGKNEVSNITPLSAEVHYDRQGIHAIDSPYSRMDRALGGEVDD